MTTTSFLAETYAGLLTSTDVMQLFSYLEKSLGSRSKAAKMCGITRKTVYDWERTGDLKLKTKIKVLSSLLERVTEEAFDYILKRAGENTEEVLRSYFQVLYESAMVETDRQRFLSVVIKFDEIRRKYAKYTVGLEGEVAKLLIGLEDRAKSLSVDWLPRPVEVFSIDQLKAIVPLLAREITAAGPRLDEAEIALKINIPRELVKITVSSLQTTVKELRQPMHRFLALDWFSALDRELERMDVWSASPGTLAEKRSLILYRSICEQLSTEISSLHERETRENPLLQSPTSTAATVPVTIATLTQ